VIGTDVNVLSRDALADRVYVYLRDQILNLEMEPGSKLNIDKLSRDLRVSPTPIREALNRLASERLVETEPFRGFRVQRLLDPEEIQDLFEARAVIEVAASAGSIGGLTSSDHQQLSALIAEMQQIAEAPRFDFAAFNRVDGDFHQAIVTACGNRFLLECWGQLQVHAQIARIFSGTPPEVAVAANIEHRRILGGLMADDLAGTQSAIRSHITDVLERLNTAKEST
jgi:DNA-binding GntR family transcriptional regulator